LTKRVRRNASLKTLHSKQKYYGYVQRICNHTDVVEYAICNYLEALLIEVFV